LPAWIASVFNKKHNGYFLLVTDIWFGVMNFSVQR